MTKIFGHRGAAGYALENTLESFLKAKQADVDYIEADVWETSDGELVIFHDARLTRITDHQGFINNYTLSELGSVKLSNGENIMLLSGLCYFCKQKDLKLFIELKSDNIAEKAKIIIEKHLPSDQYILGSFFHEQIELIKDLHPEIQTCLIFEGVFYKLADYLKLVRADYISAGFESCNDSLVTSVKNSGKKLIFWTIDDKEDCLSALKYNPYGLVTNYPSEIKQIVLNAFIA